MTDQTRLCPDCGEKTYARRRPERFHRGRWYTAWLHVGGSEECAKGEG